MTRLGAYRLEALIFAFVFGLSAYFYNGYGWNQTARYDAIWAFVEPGPHRFTVAIDDFLVDPDEGLNTGDFARNPERGERYYSNKAPGTTLLGIPAYLVLYHGERLVGAEPLSVQAVLVNAYLINLWVTALPVALSAVFFFHLALTLAGSRRRALLLTLVLYAGTLMLPFSTSLWGHTTAAALTVMALAMFVRSGRGAAAWSGLCVGLAVLTDYAAAPVALTLVAAALAGSARRERVTGLLLGGAGPLVVFALYHWVLFGSPLRLASAYSPESMLDEGRMQGLFGAVSPTALWGLTVSVSRGLFFYMPVLALSLLGMRRMRDDVHRSFWWLAVANMALILVINASFNGWHGGVTAGPRYQIVALPFYVLMLALLPPAAWARGALYGLAALSFANMLVLAAVSPMSPNTLHGSPLLFAFAKLWRVVRVDLGVDLPPVGGPPSLASLHTYPTFLMRDWPITLQDPVIERWTVFNLGERLLGLRGSWSLLPVLLGAVGLGVWMRRIVADERRVLPPPGLSSSQSVHS